jgi:cytochrome c oxidase assembly protein subunit 15
MLREVSPQRFRAVALLALVALTAIVVTGAAVRLTGSGLGCTDWPGCTDTEFVPARDGHAWVEFGNRIVSGLVGLVVVALVVAAHRRRPRRTDLVRLSWGIVAGTVAQVVVGAITVRTHLSPPVVMLHFALSMVLLANAVVLWQRASWPGDVAPVRPPGSAAQATAATAVLPAAAVVVFLGMVVTGAGPHGGDEHVERLAVSLPSVARLHGASALVFAALVIVLCWLVRGERGSPVRRRAVSLAAVTAAQVAIGYTQYFTGVPEVLVALHVLGASVLWITATMVVTARPVVAAGTVHQPGLEPVAAGR